MYKCLSCGRDVEIDINISKKVICPFCGYRIIKKTRPVVVKKVQAR
jgi:DNA-directed RNA polymerase subunit RPC12/RpoP